MGKNWCDGCDGTGLMEGWNHRDGKDCPKCDGVGTVAAKEESLTASPKPSEAVIQRRRDATYIAELEDKIASLQEASDAEDQTLNWGIKWRAKAIAIKEASDAMEKALREIADPIAKLRAEADARGYRLDGRIARQLADDPHYLKSIAREALALYAKVKG